MKFNPKIICAILLLAVIATPLACIYFFTGDGSITLMVGFFIGIITLGGLGKAFEAGFNATTLLNTLNDLQRTKRDAKAGDDRET